MNAIIQSKTVYGEVKFYPMNAVAQGLADIAGTKTLTLTTLKIAENMGITVTELPVFARV